MPDMDTARSEQLPQGPVVDADWLADHLDDVVVVDASIMGERGAATGIPGARRFDLDGPLSDQEADIPHTMLGADDFAQRLGELGIGDETVVVAYDRQGLFSSARAWWMLRAAGVGTPYVLDGGLPAWVASGRPEGPLDDSPEPVAAPRVQLDPRAFTDADDVARRLVEHDGAVADARSAERFAGTVPEPRPGLRAGHMPGAVSLPFSDLAPGGHLLPPAELDDLLQQRLGGRGPVAFSCGSGVSACVGALAAVAAGWEDRDLTIYDGSWSEWGRETEDLALRPVVRRS